MEIVLSHYTTRACYVRADGERSIFVLTLVVFLVCVSKGMISQAVVPVVVWEKH